MGKERKKTERTDRRSYQGVKLPGQGIDQNMGQPGWDMWQKIIQFDRMSGRKGYMILFLGDSIYFMLVLCGDYEAPIYLANMSAAVVMAFMFYGMVRFTSLEGEHWRPLYEKIKYFPVDRRKYLLAKTVPAAKILGLQLAIQWTAFVCRMLMQRGIAPEAMGMVSLCTAVSGIWFFLSFLGMFAAGERALYLFPALFVTGIGMANALGNAMAG